MRRRRALMLLGGAVGATGLAGRYMLLPPAPGASLRPVRDLLVSLHDSMDDATRARACVPYDHPLRQYHNRGVRGGGLPVSALSFSWEQRGMLTDLLHAGLSEQGRTRIPREHYINWPGVHLLSLLMCGDPRDAEHQTILTGPHLNLRLGGAGREGVAFGGPQVYGDQRGNERPGLPGNLYRDQYEIGRALFESLTDGQKRAALLDLAPPQTRIEVRGRDAGFDGIPVESLSVGSRALAGRVVEAMLSTYHPDDVAYAASCLRENGGIERLHLSYYRRADDGGIGNAQIFRLEGPAAVFHFRGYPHVHAFINVARDADHPLSVGEVLGTNPAPLEGSGVKRLFENAMREASGADAAFYGDESVVGRLRGGIIRTGDIYTLESWQEPITVMEIRGSRLKGPALEQFRREAPLAPDRVYAIAVAGYVDGGPAEQSMGSGVTRRTGILVRDAAITWLRTRGFGQTVT
jgi:hypothetical protein